MSALARPLLALAAAALLLAACADPQDAPPDDNRSMVESCSGILIGRRSPQYERGGATDMPVPVTTRYGYVSIPPYGLIGVQVVGKYVMVCNMAGPTPPVVARDEHDAPPDSRVFVYLPDGRHGPADMEMTVWYFLEPLWHD